MEKVSWDMALVVLNRSARKENRYFIFFDRMDRMDRIDFYMRFNFRVRDFLFTG